MTASYCRFRKEYPPAIAPFYGKERAVSGLCSNAINSRINTTKGPGPPGIRVRQSATSVAKIRQGRAYAVRIRTRLPVRPGDSPGTGTDKHRPQEKSRIKFSGNSSRSGK